MTIHVTRLLDMPVDETLLGSAKQYRIRVLDLDERDLHKTGPIDGMPGDISRDLVTETVMLDPREGIFFLHTDCPVVFLEVRYTGGFFGNRVIGRCKIHRHDPRSSQVWPYALTAKDGEPAGCGIELCTQEGGAAAMPPPQTMAPPLSPRMSMATVPSQGPSSPRGAIGMPLGTQGLASPTESLFTAMRVEKVEDLPAHAAGGAEVREQVVVTLQDAGNAGMDLGQAGPFNTTKQGGSPLREAVCIGPQAQTMIKARYLVGGEAGDGAMFVTAKVWYLTAGGRRDLVGQTEPIPVTWQPRKSVYHELRPKPNSPPIGGVILSYRLAEEGQAMMEGMRPSIPPNSAPRLPQSVPTVPRRSTNFPPGSPEEAQERALLNFQAQNRANIQRIKACTEMPLQHGQEDAHFRMNNRYREFRNLDSLFRSLGPTPVLEDPRIGTDITRGYTQQSTIMAEVDPRMHPERRGPPNPADGAADRRLVAQLYNGNPDRVETLLRPEICKDPVEVAETGDMRWAPNPPMYTPMRNMTEDDQETLHLSRYTPDQSAKLWFCDASPNYNIKQDVWGVLRDVGAGRSNLVMPNHVKHEKRVKDDCIMA